MSETATRPGTMGTRLLDDGRELCVYVQLFNCRLTIGDPETQFYDDFYCYLEPGDAETALHTWDGKGDPPGRWVRHGASGRRRPDGDPASEYIA